MPKPFPKEFRDDVVAIALKRESSFAQIAQDFGISESCVQRWVKIAEVDGGRRPGVTSSEAAENRELRKRVKLLEQEVEILRRAAAYLSQANLSGPKGSTRS
ncbi:MAG: transposase [Microbacterium sp. 13-71-7]|nr:MAG: transposase [Microbacterium sp. 13-71-7]